MMLDDLGRSQMLRVPRAVRILDQCDVVPKRERSPASRINTKLGLNSGNR
jgi:hypothetical protein